MKNRTLVRRPGAATGNGLRAIRHGYVIRGWTRRLVRLAAVTLALGHAPGFLLSSPAWAAEAGPLTAARLGSLGGTDFDGGPGDLFLRNDRIEATILGITATPDFGIPVVAEALPGRGVIVDLGTVGDKNDQLTEIDHVVNLGQNAIFYGGPAEGLPEPVIVSGGPTASITVFGVVLLEPFSSLSSPGLTAETTYAVTDGKPWIDIRTTVTNNLSDPVPVFSIADVDVLGGRGRLPFQPMEDRGHKSPLLDLSAPESAIGIWPWLSLPGNNGPQDGPVNYDLSPAGKVTYTFVASSLQTPLIGVADPLVAVAGSFFDLAALQGGAPPTIPPIGQAPANRLVFDRKLVVTNDNTVESGLEVALPLLYAPVFGADLRAAYTGRVVDGNGTGIPDVHVFIDNTVPGAPDLSPLVSVRDENLDGAADGIDEANGLDPLPVSHTVTAADGSFTVKLQAMADPGIQASEYMLTIQAENRSTVRIGPLAVDPTTLGRLNVIPDIVLEDLGRVSYTVTESGSGRSGSFEGWPRRPLGPGTTPAKLTFVGIDGTPDPDFGNQYLTRRNFSLVEPNGPFPLSASGSQALSNTLAGSPALNTVADLDGTGTVELPPGDYLVYGSRGLEYSIDMQRVTVIPGTTAQVSLTIRRVVNTRGYVSMDFHVHSARSFDSSAPLQDRVAAYVAEGVEAIVATDHDSVTDYAPLIASLDVGREIGSVIGEELSGGLPVPADPTQGDLQLFPEGIGHWIAWPLSVNANSRRGGAPPDEFLTPGTAIDRLRGMDSLVLLGATPDTAGVADWLPAIQAGHEGTVGASLPPDEEVVMFNHPRAGFSGTVVIGMLNTLANPGGNPALGGYNPALPVTAFPNNALLTPSLYNKAIVGPDGTDTTALSFDAIELMNGGTLGSFLAVRRDWCGLLKQGFARTATAVSDSHRVVMESAGFGRSFVASSTDAPASIDHDELARSIKRMNVVGTSGPFLRFQIEDDAGVDRQMGETAVVTGDAVVVKVRVEAAPWIPVQEVRVYRNCDLVATRVIPPSKVLGQVLRYSGAIPIAGIDADSFVTVEASVRLDANGDPRDPVLLATMQTVEPEVVPLGFTNPIFVDRDGNGYQAPGL